MVATRGGASLPGPVDELGQRLALGPFERQVLQSVGGAEIVGLDDVGMRDAGAVLRLAEESLDGDRIPGEAGTQNLDRRQSALRVLGPIHGRGTALADVLREMVARYRATDEVVCVHGTAKLVNLQSCSKLDVAVGVGRA